MTVLISAKRFDPNSEVLRAMRFAPLTDGPAFAVTMLDTGRTDHRGATIVRTRVRCIKAGDGFSAGQIVFDHEEIALSPCDASDSDAAFGSVLGWLSLKPGDTDADFFEDYSDPQIEFAESFGEHLSLEAVELEGAE
jgi:hypothetical protein